MIPPRFHGVPPLYFSGTMGITQAPKAISYVGLFFFLWLLSKHKQHSMVILLLDYFISEAEGFFLLVWFVSNPYQKDEEFIMGLIILSLCRRKGLWIKTWLRSHWAMKTYCDSWYILKQNNSLISDGSERAWFYFFQGIFQFFTSTPRLENSEWIFTK